ncbi:MAG: immune inhibitor A [Phycisphaerae bacterium]|nr:immune inhibitor A [Phycisphaerae bacterium]
MIKRLHLIVAVSVSIWSCGGAVGDVTPGEPSDAVGAGSPKSLIRVDVSSAASVKALKQVLRSLDDAGTVDPGRSLDLVVTDRDMRRLTAAGIPFGVVIEDIEQAKDRARASYHSFPAMEAALSAMATSYPAITQLTSIGTGWEAAGRNIWCLEISDNPGVDEGEVGLVFMGLHHAREWPSLEIALDIANRLTSNYGSDPTITDLVNNQRIWVIPCVNPDGYVWDHDQGHDWRQNRHTYPGGIGVDLNRNYDGSADGDKDGEWGSIGTGSQTHQQGYSTYVGPSPFSEPETQAVRDFFNARDVTIAISYHTYSELVLWPWGFNGSATTDDNALLISLGQGMAAQIGGQSGGTYTPQQSADLYPTTGASDDWIYGYRYYELGKNTLAYTVEMAQSFHPSESQLQQILNENWDGAFYILQQAAYAESQLTPFVLPPILSTPPVDADGDFTVSWVQQNPDAGADLYALQELTGLSKLTDGAESGTGNWSMQQFLTSTARAHSGSHSFKSPTGDERIAAMTTTDPLPVETGDDLTFWTWYAIETDWDMAFVEVSIDGRQYDVLDKFTGSSGWTQKTYSLDAYAGRSIYVRFRYTTDSYTTEEGFYVDDIYPVASWSSIDTLSSSITDTWYEITGRADGDYYYRVRGSSPTRGFGDYCDLGMTSVFVDCNANGISDAEDIANCAPGESWCNDCNENEVPDACDEDYTDIAKFVGELLKDFPDQDDVLVCMFDQSDDDKLDGSDVQGFVNRLLSP